MKAIVMTLVAAGAALAVSPASAQWGGPSPSRARYAAPYGRPDLGGCSTGRCGSGGCPTGACADRCGCEPGLCETGRCGADCDMTACGGCAGGSCSDGGCPDGRCGSASLRPVTSVRPLPRRPLVDPAPTLGRRPGRPAAPGYSPYYGPSPFTADGAARRNW